MSSVYKRLSSTNESKCRSWAGEMRLFVIGIALILGGLLAFSYAGALHPAGDSFAVFRQPLAMLFGLVVIWSSWSWMIRWPLATLAIAAILHMSLPVLRAGTLSAEDISPDHDFTLYQQNLLFSRHGDNAWLDAVQRQEAELVTLQEVSGRNLALLEDLKADYPHQTLCPFAAIGGVAVLSKWPALETRCAENNGLAAMKVDAPSGPIWIVSLHLHWPWPYRQPAQVSRLIPVLEALDGDVVIGGDFNSVRWSYTVRRIAVATGTEMAGPYRPTFQLPKLRTPIGIDHVLTDPSFFAQVYRVETLGSDHNGVIGKLTRKSQ